MSNFDKVPKFKTEAEEKRFWETHDSTNYIDWSKAKPARFPKLKPSTKSISIRLPATLLEGIQIIANKNDVPYQSLIKMMLAESLHSKNQSLSKFHLINFRTSYKQLKQLFSKKKISANLLNIEVGALLQQFRDEMNINDKQLADRMDIKVPELKALEHGERSVLGTKLEERIEKLFNIQSFDENRDNI